jgi:hypothetical protein
MIAADCSLVVDPVAEHVGHVIDPRVGRGTIPCPVAFRVRSTSGA